MEIQSTREMTPYFTMAKCNKLFITYLIAGNVWSGEDANISSKNTRSTMKINSYSAS